eukprot:6213178-Pleurochrysis_carterae.AAC.5
MATWHYAITHWHLAPDADHCMHRDQIKPKYAAFGCFAARIACESEMTTTWQAHEARNVLARSVSVHQKSTHARNTSAWHMHAPTPHNYMNCKHVKLA